MLSVKEDILKNVGKQTVVGKHFTSTVWKKSMFLCFYDGWTHFFGLRPPFTVIIKHGSQDIYFFIKLTLSNHLKKEIHIHLG